MIKTLTRSLAPAVAGLALAASAATPAVAAETIRMVAIDGYPARAMWVKEFSEFFIPEVNKRLAETGNHEIEWQEAYGGTIVKPVFEFPGGRRFHFTDPDGYELAVWTANA